MSVFEGLSRYWNHRHDVELFCAAGRYLCHGTHSDRLLENINNAYYKLKLSNVLRPNQVGPFFDGFLNYYLTSPALEWTPYIPEELTVIIYHNHYCIPLIPVNTMNVNTYFFNKIANKDDAYHLSWLSCNHWSNVIDSLMYGIDIENYIIFATAGVLTPGHTLNIPRIPTAEEDTFRQITYGDYSEFCILQELPALAEYNVTAVYNQPDQIDPLFDNDNFQEVNEYVGLIGGAGDPRDPAHPSNQIILETAYKGLILDGGNPNVVVLCKQFKTCQKLLTRFSIDYSGVDLFVFIIQCFEHFRHIHVPNMRDALTTTTRLINDFADGIFGATDRNRAGSVCIVAATPFINVVKDELGASSGVNRDVIERTVNELFLFVVENTKNQFKNFMIGVEKIKFWILLFCYLELSPPEDVPIQPHYGPHPPPPPPRYQYIGDDRMLGAYMASLGIGQILAINFQEMVPYQHEVDILRREGFQSLRRRHDAILQYPREIRRDGYNSYEGYNRYLSLVSQQFYISQYYLSQYYGQRSVVGPPPGMRDHRIRYTQVEWEGVMRVFLNSVEYQRREQYAEAVQAAVQDATNRMTEARDVIQQVNEVEAVWRDREVQAIAVERTAMEERVAAAGDRAREREVQAIAVVRTAMEARAAAEAEEVAAEARTLKAKGLHMKPRGGPELPPFLSPRGVPYGNPSLQRALKKVLSEKARAKEAKEAKSASRTMTVTDGGTRKRKKQTRKNYSRIKKSQKKRPKTRKTR